MLYILAEVPVAEIGTVAVGGSTIIALAVVLVRQVGSRSQIDEAQAEWWRKLLTAADARAVDAEARAAAAEQRARDAEEGWRRSESAAVELRGQLKAAELARDTAADRPIRARRQVKP